MPSHRRFISGNFKCHCQSDFEGTVELHLFRLLGTGRHPDKRKIQMFEFFFENRLHAYLLTNKTLICNSLHVFVSWGTNLSYKMLYNYGKTIFTPCA